MVGDINSSFSLHSLFFTEYDKPQPQKDEGILSGGIQKPELNF